MADLRIKVGATVDESLKEALAPIHEAVAAMDRLQGIRARFGERATGELVIPEDSPIRVFHRQPQPPLGDKHAPRGAYLDEYMAMYPAAVEQAFFSFFFDDEDCKPYEMDGSVAVVSIDGPLMQRGGWWYDGYQAIRGRFGKALADKAVTAIVLKINSPGGVCSGCFSAAREMRAMKEKAGKPVLTYADESAFSAAYAMACIADEIYLPPEGGVGSVGVIGVLYDRTAANEKEGYRVAVITSGEYKADGHPDVAMTKAVVARYQERITALGRSFAELVGAARNTTAEAVLKLEAACLYGEEAVTRGLADKVATLEQVVANAQNQGLSRMPRAQTISGPAGASNGDDMDKQNQTPAPATDKTGASVELLSIASFASFALAIGLAHDASEGDILAAVGQMKGDAAKTTAAVDKLLEAHGAKSAEEAIGKLEAERTTHGELVKAVFGSFDDTKSLVEQSTAALAKLGADRKNAEISEAKTLIEQAAADGKTVGEKAQGIYDKHGIDALKAHLDALVPHPALTKPSPVQKDEKGGATPAGASSEEIVLTADEKEFCEKYGIAVDAFTATRKREIADRKAAAAQ